MSLDKSNKERGFVLATSLVLLSLLTMLSIAVYFSTQVSQKTTASAESATEAFYYAETAVNYVSWALLNDAEFDSFIYPDAVDADGRFTFSEPDVRGALPDPELVGDRKEWLSNIGNPSGDDSVSGTFDNKLNFGQLMYMDNRPIADRTISWPNSASPVLFNISKELPRYIRLDIDENGDITVALPPYSPNFPHHGTEKGVDIPLNGAVVWLTAGDKQKDRYLYPVDMYAAPFLDVYSHSIVDSNKKRWPWQRDASGNIPVDASGNKMYIPLQDGLGREYPDPLGSYYQNIPCDILAMETTSSQILACDGTSGEWLQSGQYGLVAYAVGFVNGKARKMIRTVLFF
ncbi:MAG: hypothetical protein CO186_00825 [Zetaproteobacteria bacterium CG_4_9_14_3_um_filter_49_83]|nr:MAG: hypothetical protein AUJ56_02160 [Zetaproteobacteria bacterium CG1_02_49_23]PIQ30008.1 MAG: hypothetical protein COW62_13400 [Zetaproteobacteria bacterium CG17_big_fil_post_rev_8_21_14_2_50_50_13]PIV30378.1 MAG: hypothetical protein COS35_07065 [Zetaproteobacteria bacterium CG02_land_8_20_14_3_00_50_9]PIY56044.1 MAG: hypothetical protein COZ00_06875 [Zetaproteobacteria bacterium CG_4_10_14_0_8_um_filter_49_80]PJA36280.1 MAG: hypothetical protein CO186_00825 [Zetaproteobacteria bacterium